MGHDHLWADIKTMEIVGNREESGKGKHTKTERLNIALGPFFPLPDSFKRFDGKEPLHWVKKRKN